MIECAHERWLSIASCLWERLTVVNILPGVAVVAPGVDFLYVRSHLQALVQLHGAI